jgi:hypothetical protein
MRPSKWIQAAKHLRKYLRSLKLSYAKAYRNLAPGAGQSAEITIPQAEGGSAVDSAVQAAQSDPSSPPPTTSFSFDADLGGASSPNEVMLNKRQANGVIERNLESLEERWFEELTNNIAKRDDTPAPSVGCLLYVIYGSEVLLNISLPTNQTHFATPNVTYQEDASITYREVCAADSNPVAVIVSNIAQTITIPPPPVSSSNSSAGTVISLSGSATGTIVQSSGSMVSGSAGQSNQNPASTSASTCKQADSTGF